MRLGDVIERHHDDAEKEHRGDGADPVPVRGQDAVLICSASPTHQLKRSQIGGDEAETRDPGGHLAAGQEELFAGVGGSFDVEADEENNDEIQKKDQDIDGSERGELMGLQECREGRLRSGSWAQCSLSR